MHEKVFNYTSHLSGHTSRFLPGNTVVYLHMILTLYHSATGCMVSEDALQAPPSDGARCGGGSARDQALRGCAADHGGFRLPMAYSHDILMNKNGTRNPLCPVLGGSLPAQGRRSAPSAGGRRRGKNHPFKPVYGCSRRSALFAEKSVPCRISLNRPRLRAEKCSVCGIQQRKEHRT